MSQCEGYSECSCLSVTKNIDPSHPHVFSSIIDLADGISEDLFFVLDPEKNIVRASDVAIQLYEKNSQNPLGKKCYELFLGKSDTCSRPPETCFIRQILTNGRSCKTITTHNINGRQFIVSIKATPILDDRKQISHILVILQNITTDQEFRDSAENFRRQYKTLCELAPEGLFAVDRNGIITEANSTWLNLFGYSRDEIIGKRHIADLMEEEQSSIHKQELAKLALGETIPCAEIKWLRKDGTTFWSRVRTRPLKNDNAKESSVALGSIRDLSDLTEAHEKLEKSDEFMRALLDSLGEGVLVLDHDYRILETNKGFLDITGRRPDEVMGRPCYKISHDSDVPCWEIDNGHHECPVRKAFENGKAASTVHVHKDSEGKEKFVRVSAFPMRDKNGTIYQVIETHTDITEQKLLEDKLMQAQKMESIGTLAGGIAHDFNNILTPILGNAQIALFSLAPDSPSFHELQEIQAAAQRAAQMVRQILAFSRRQVLEKKDVDINPVIRELLKMLYRLMREDITIDCVLDENLWNISADVGQVEQIILNLAVNARDAMPEGGRILIETKNVDAMENICHTCGQLIKGPHVLLMVSDNGCGMDKETSDRIFEPFFTTKEVGHGTGMGLSTVVGIMHQHHGHINVYSEPGTGSTFKVYLPKQESAADNAAADDLVTRNIVPTGHETILLVEDDESVCEIAEKMLSSLGYTIITAKNGRQALKIFKESDRGIGLVLTDIIMPDIGGRALVDELLKGNPKLPVLFMSGYSLNAVHHHFVLNKDVKYLQKPFTLDRLARKVREAIDLRKPDF